MGEREALIEVLGEAFQPGPPMTVGEIADRVLALLKERNEASTGDEPARAEYRHYKGGRYSVMGVCRHTENREQLVIYYSMADAEMHARPLGMFMDEGRFERVP